MKVTIRLVLLSALLAGLSSFNARGAYLSEGTGDSGMRETEEAPPVRWPVPPPPPRDGAPLRRLLRQVEIGRPYAYGRMAVFPLDIRNPDNRFDIRTLDDALNRGWITIREHEKARVSAVVVRNESRHTVFMMAGEILGGGLQDRILQKDILLTPGIGEVTVPVYCGEKNRWMGSRDSFDRAPHIAGKSMRGMAAREDSQEAIWSEIDRRLSQSNVETATRSYQSLYSDPDAGRRIADRVERFRHVRTRRTVGLVVVDSGRVVGADLFGDPDLCASLWDKIVRSYVADYPREDDWRIQRERVDGGSSGAVGRFLDDLSRAGQSAESTPGAGESFALWGWMDGHVLEWNGGLVHASAFSRHEVRPLPGIPLDR